MPTESTAIEAERIALSRRGFMGRVGNCTLGAAFLAGCDTEYAELYTDGPSGLKSDASFSTTSHPGLAKTGGMARVKGDGALLVLVRKDDDTVLAYDALCPHAFCEMTPSSAGGVGAWDDSKNHLVCQCHASRFEEDGKYVVGSTMGGWDSPKPVGVYKVEFNKASGEGVVKAS